MPRSEMLMFDSSASLVVKLNTAVSSTKSSGVYLTAKFVLSAPPAATDPEGAPTTVNVELPDIDGVLTVSALVVERFITKIEMSRFDPSPIEPKSVPSLVLGVVSVGVSIMALFSPCTSTSPPLTIPVPDTSIL